MDGDRFPTPAQTFTDAVCASADLSTVEAMVLLAYARATKRGADAAWLTQHRIMNECKIRSSATVVKARRFLIKKGWLVPVDVVAIRGGVATVYRLTNPSPDSLGEQGNGLPGSVSEPGEARSGSLGEQGGTRSGSLTEPGGSPCSVSEQGDDEPGSPSEPLYDVKVFTSEADPVHSVMRSGSLSEQGISPQDGPPFRGGSMSGARGGAQARARTRGAAAPPGAAPRRDEKASTNGELSPTARDAIASMRSIPGRPSKAKPDVHGTPRTDPGGEHR